MKKILLSAFTALLAITILIPSSVFAATAHSWTERRPAGNSDFSWKVLASDSDSSFFIAGNSYPGRLFISEDGGVTWAETQPADNTNQSWESADADADGSNLIVGASSGRLYTSSDGGANWTERRPAGDTNQNWYEVASDNDGSNLIAAHTNRLYTSTDGGANWTERRPAGDTNISWSVASDDDGSFLLAGNGSLGRLYTSLDGGVNWTERQPAGAVNRNWAHVASDSDGSNLIAGIQSFGGSAGLYTSSNSGVNWTVREPGGNVDAAWVSLASDADGSHLFATYGGVFGEGAALYSSDDSGSTWVEEPIPGGASFSTKITSNTDGTNLLASEGTRLYSAPDNVAATISSFNPTDDATEIGIDGTFDVTFDEDIALGTGNITLMNSNDIVVEEIDVEGPNVTLSDTDTLTIDPTVTLDLATGYYFLIDAGAIEDVPGNAFAGISDPTTWSFTSDALPLISSLTPLDDAVDVFTTDSLVFVFDQDMQLGIGNITVKKVLDDSTVQTIDVPASYNWDGAHTVVSFNPSGLEYATEYYVLIDAGAFEDTNGNPFAGISDPTTWSFTTGPGPFDFERVSVDDEGVEGDGASDGSSVSSDGRYVAFSSSATNLVLDDTNGMADIFVYDRSNGSIEQVSVSVIEDVVVIANDPNTIYDRSVYDPNLDSFGPTTHVELGSLGDWNDIIDGEAGAFLKRPPVTAGTESGGLKSDPSGHFLFQDAICAPDSDPVNVKQTYPRYADVCVKSTVTGLFYNLNITSWLEGGQEVVSGAGNASSPAISSDGRYVVFQSNASNLVSDDTNAQLDVFMYDRDTDTTERVSVNIEGGDGDNDSSNASISTDGRYVAFGSGASNLVPLDVNGVNDIFIYDATVNSIERLDIDPGLLYFNNNSDEVKISGDGMYIAFELFDENTFFTGLYLYDVTADTWERIDVNNLDEDGNGSVGDFDLSDDGQYVVFSSESTNLTDDVVDGGGAVFLYNRVTGGIEFIKDVASDSHPTISGDGRFLVYIGPDETEDNFYVYRYDTETNTEIIITENTGSADGGASASYPDVSEDGSVIAFTSPNTDLVDDDTNEETDIFVYDDSMPVVEEPLAEEESSGGGSSRRHTTPNPKPDDTPTLLEQLQLQLIELLKQLLAELLKAQ